VWSGLRDPFFNFDTRSRISNTRSHISRTAEVKVAKCSMQVEYIKCLALDDRLLPNGHGQGHVTRFHFKF